MITTACWLTLLAGLWVATPALGQVQQVVFDFSGALGEDGLPPQWSFRRWAPVVTLGSTFEATARVVETAGQPVLYVKTASSGFIVGTEKPANIEVLRRATWSWLAETLPQGASFKQRSTNDQVLQLLFGFEGGNIVGYIWDSTGQVGDSGSGLSWQQDVRVIVLQAGSAKLGQWVQEQRDLYADYQRLFQAEPPPLVGVAVQCNSQHTASSGSGYVSAITLTAP